VKYLIDTNILLEILPINYRARVHKKTAVDDPPGILLPAQALGGVPRQAQRASERQTPWDTKPVRSQLPSPTLWERGWG